MKKGFTLAEVLITLAIIGVVAALTIPVLVQKYQNRQLYTQFMKSYNTIAKVMSTAVAQHGGIENWKWGNWVKQNDEEVNVGGKDPINNYIFALMNVTKKCSNPEDCFAPGYVYLNGHDGVDPEYPEDSLLGDLFSELGYPSAVALADGSAIAAGGYSEEIIFLVDTNGKKGPNVLGRDLFWITYLPEDEYYNQKEGIRLPNYDANASNDSSDTSGSYRNGLCNPNSPEEPNGFGCAARLIQEGTMNY